MTKADIVNEIARRTGISRQAVTDVMESFMQTVKEYVANGEILYLRGFGSFGPKIKKEKVARNISKGTSIVIPEHKEPAFKPSPEFKKLLK